MRRNLQTFNCFENIMNASLEMLQSHPRRDLLFLEVISKGKTYQKIAKDFKEIILLICYCKCFHFLLIDYTIIRIKIE